MEKEKTIIAVEEKAAVAELEQNDLDQVVGAGDPFKDLPRVPEQLIDDDLREDG